MGFFNDLVAVANELTELRDEVVSTVVGAADDVKSVGNDTVNSLTESANELKQTVSGATNNDESAQ